MPRPKLEIADIFRAHGPAWQQANAGHVSLTQLKVMSAIEACRTEALGGHVAGCAKCGHHHIAYNSCKNRHCPKCQGPAARDWMAARAEDLLPVEYFHVVFTIPAEIAQIAFWNKQAVYGLLFRASAETVMTIAADPKRLGAKIGMTSVLHTWGSALTHHPHTRACHAAIAARGAAAVIPPRKNGKPWKEITAGATARNGALRSCRRLGRAIWKRWTGYHRRSLVEAKMRCLKLLGERVMSRDFDRQVAELQIRAAILNRFTSLGTPLTQRAG